MSTIATLTVRLTADSSSLQKSLRDASRAAKRFGAGMRKMANVAGKALVGGITAATAALTAMIKKSAEAGDKLAKTADAIGITTESLAGLQHAAEITGVSGEKMSKSLLKMQKNIGDVLVKGTGEAEDALGRLGLKAEDLVNLKADEQFKIIAERMTQVGSATERTSIAMGLFGRQGAELVNTMNIGADGLEEMQKEAELLGIALTRTETAKFEQMNDSIQRGKSVLQGFQSQLSVQFAPIVTHIVTKFVEWAKSIGGLGEVARRVFNFIITGVGKVADAVRGLKVVWLGLKTVAIGFGSALAESFRFLINDFMIDFNNKVRELILTPLRTVVNALSPFSETARKAGAALDTLANVSRVEWVDTMADKLNNDLRVALEELKTAAQEEMPSIALLKQLEKAEEIANNLAQGTAGQVEGQQEGLAGSTFEDPEADKEKDKLAADLERLRVSLLSQEDALLESYVRRQEILFNSMEQGLLTEQKFQDMSLQLKEDYFAKLDEMRNEDKKKEIDVAKSAMDALAGLANSKNKKLAAIGKVALAVKKTMALKELLMSQSVSMGRAMEAGPIAGIAQMAVVVAQFASLIGGLDGQAHAGLTNVPREGTFLLDKGERVLSPGQNKDLTSFLSKNAANTTSTNAATSDIVTNVEPKVVVVDSEEKALDALGSDVAGDVIITHLERNPERASEALGIAS